MRRQYLKLKLKTQMKMMMMIVFTYKRNDKLSKLKIKTQR